MMEKGKMGKWGNKIGYVLLPFSIGLREDPLDYVREAKSIIDQKKASLEPMATYFVADLVLKFFGIKVYLLLLLLFIKSRPLALYIDQFFVAIISVCFLKIKICR